MNIHQLLQNLEFSSSKDTQSTCEQQIISLLSPSKPSLNASDDFTQPQQQCQIHVDEQLLFCCFTCNRKALCVECITGGQQPHKQHDIRNIKAAQKDTKQVITSTLQSLKQKIDYFDQNLESYTNFKNDVIENQTEIQNFINQQFTDLLSLVQQKQQQLTYELQKKSGDQIKELDEIVQKNKSKMKVFIESHKFLESQVLNLNEQQLYNYYVEKQQTIQDLQNYIETKSSTPTGQYRSNSYNKKLSFNFDQEIYQKINNLQLIQENDNNFSSLFNNNKLFNNNNNNINIVNNQNQSVFPNNINNDISQIYSQQTIYTSNIKSTLNKFNPVLSPEKNNKSYLSITQSLLNDGTSSNSILKSKRFEAQFQDDLQEIKKTRQLQTKFNLINSPPSNKKEKQVNSLNSSQIQMSQQIQTQREQNNVIDKNDVNNRSFEELGDTLNKESCQQRRSWIKEQIETRISGKISNRQGSNSKQRKSHSPLQQFSNNMESPFFKQIQLEKYKKQSKGQLNNQIFDEQQNLNQNMSSQQKLQNMKKSNFQESNNKNSKANLFKQQLDQEFSSRKSNRQNISTVSASKLKQNLREYSPTFQQLEHQQKIDQSQEIQKNLAGFLSPQQSPLRNQESQITNSKINFNSNINQNDRLQSNNNKYFGSSVKKQSDIFQHLLKSQNNKRNNFVSQRQQSSVQLNGNISKQYLQQQQPRTPIKKY